MFSLDTSLFTAVVFMAGSQFGTFTKSNFKQWNWRKSLGRGDRVNHRTPAASSDLHWFYLCCRFHVIRGLIYCLMPTWLKASCALTSSHNPKPNLSRRKRDEQNLHTELQAKKLNGRQIIKNNCIKYLLSLPFLHPSKQSIIHKQSIINQPDRQHFL